MTCGGEKEARRIALSVLKNKLAACASYWPVNSAYRWKGKTLEEKEWMLEIKTDRKNAAALAKKIKSLHSYALPAILFSEARASKPLEKWVEESVKK